MSLELPSADMQSGILVIRFLDAVVARSVPIECVIDQSDFGDVVGIEILPFRAQLTGGRLECPQSAGAVRWSYDAEDDTLWIHVTKGRSQNQTSIVATVGLDVAQRVVRLEAPLPPPKY
jgi:uncharacterized protein YuzE